VDVDAVAEIVDEEKVVLGADEDVVLPLS